MKKITIFVAFMMIALWGKGQSWTEQTSGVTSTITNVFFINDTVGWVSTTGKVLKTTDGGANWVANTLGIQPTQILASLCFTSENIGWVVGYGGKILKTTDGGVGWTSQNSGTTRNLSSVNFVNDSIGWIVGADSINSFGTILYTSNGGTTWTPQYHLGMFTYYAAMFLDSNHGWAVGEAGGIARTVDGGANWQFPSEPGSNDLADVFFSSPSKGWAVGANGTIITSSDSGATWTTQNSGVNSSLYGVYFTSDTEGWVVGSYISGQGPTFLYTNNGGITWTRQTASTANFNVGDLCFLTSSKGWAVGTNGKILKYSPVSSNNLLQNEILLNIYPNPVDNLANISFPENGNYNIQVVDMTGRLIYTAQVSAQNLQLNTSSWAAGMYYVSIFNEKGQWESKTIVKE
jgi:photosystem II stability/assembly factor-like uncharacterized protein